MSASAGTNWMAVIRHRETSIMLDQRTSSSTASPARPHRLATGDRGKLRSIALSAASHTLTQLSSSSSSWERLARTMPKSIISSRPIVKQYSNDILCRLLHCFAFQWHIQNANAARKSYNTESRDSKIVCSKLRYLNWSTPLSVTCTATPHLGILGTFLSHF